MANGEELDLSQRLAQIDAIVEQLLAGLAAERQALADHNASALEQANDDKRKSLDALEPQSNFLTSDATRQAIRALPQPRRAEVEARHKQIMTALQRAKEFNAVNGKILARSQQSLLELVQLMSGATADPTYSQLGQVQAGGMRGASLGQA